jgi:signal peptidase II
MSSSERATITWGPTCRVVSVRWSLAAGLILVLDQASKKRVQRRFDRPAPSGLGPALTGAPVVHAPVAFGLLRSRRILVPLWVLATVGTVASLELVPVLEGQVAQLGLGAAIGGATSNMLDMLSKGSVVDFVNLRVWPVFNVADCAIVLGVIAAVVSAA